MPGIMAWGMPAGMVTILITCPLGVYTWRQRVTRFLCLYHRSHRLASMGVKVRLSMRWLSWDSWTCQDGVARDSHGGGKVWSGQALALVLARSSSSSMWWNTSSRQKLGGGNSLESINKTTSLFHQDLFQIYLHGVLLQLLGYKHGCVGVDPMAHHAQLLTGVQHVAPIVGGHGALSWGVGGLRPGGRRGHPGGQRIQI